MKISSCFCRLKALAILVNLVLLLFGIVVLSIGLCHKSLCFDTHWYLDIIEESREYFDITLFRVSSAMVGVGAQMVLLGAIGCYGTWHNSLCILGVSLVFLVVLLIEDITVILWPPAYKNAIEMVVDNVVSKEYRNNTMSIVKKQFDAIQQHLNCCGSGGPLDWSNMNYNLEDDLDISDAKASINGDGNITNDVPRIPLSCCKNSTIQSCHDYIAVDAYKQNHINESIINTQVIILRSLRVFLFIIILNTMHRLYLYYRRYFFSRVAQTSLYDM